MLLHFHASQFHARQEIMKRLITISILSTLCLFSNSYADEYLIKALGNKCKHGLHKQPGGGPFSVFLFCDDALASNIGVINTQPAAGPGNIQLSPTKIWDKWYTYDRFWQDRSWATDVNSFAWSPDLKYLYIAFLYNHGQIGTLSVFSFLKVLIILSLPVKSIISYLKEALHTVIEHIVFF